MPECIHHLIWHILQVLQVWKLKLGSAPSHTLRQQTAVAYTLSILPAGISAYLPWSAVRPARPEECAAG